MIEGRGRLLTLSICADILENQDMAILSILDETKRRRTFAIISHP